MQLTDTADVLIPELRGLQQRLLVLGGIGLAIAAVFAFFNVTQFLQSYLMAYMFCLGATLGSLALGMVHQLSGGAWGVLIRRQIGAASRVIPVMMLLFVPILLGMKFLYPWTHPEEVAQSGALQPKRLYRNAP